MRMSAAFSLVEVLISLAVIALIVAAFGAGAAMYLRGVGERKATAQLGTIAAAIEAYGRLDWPEPQLNGAGVLQRVALRPLWDMDGNNVLDGRVVADAAAGYQGFVVHTRFRCGPGDLNPNGELKDPWGEAYRIALRANDLQAGLDWNARFGGGAAGETSAYVLWSVGPDGVDDHGAGDDITSWGKP
jgi:prepilin-type N-terminal cleavage/methylation domain-containing protein